MWNGGFFDLKATSQERSVKLGFPPLYTIEFVYLKHLFYAGNLIGLLEDLRDGIFISMKDILNVKKAGT